MHPDPDIPHQASPDEVRTTGLGAVDAVLDDVAGVAERPVHEHVAVFEQAHDRLRRALDARPDA